LFSELTHQRLNRLLLPLSSGVVAGLVVPGIVCSIRITHCPAFQIFQIDLVAGISPQLRNHIIYTIPLICRYLIGIENPISVGIHCPESCHCLRDLIGTHRTGLISLSGGGLSLPGIALHGIGGSASSIAATAGRSGILHPRGLRSALHPRRHPLSPLRRTAFTLLKSPLRPVKRRRSASPITATAAARLSNQNRSKTEKENRKNR
jgi:hypothetical protein